MTMTNPHIDGSHARAFANPNSYEFHKNIFRSPKFEDEMRKASAQWLIANGVVFDNDKFIDPERLPV